MGRVIESFSFAPKYLVMIEQVKEYAKEHGISFSELVLSLCEQYAHTRKAEESKQTQDSTPKEPPYEDYKAWAKHLQNTEDLDYIAKKAEEFARKRDQESALLDLANKQWNIKKRESFRKNRSEITQ